MLVLHASMVSPGMHRQANLCVCVLNCATGCARPSISLTESSHIYGPCSPQLCPALGHTVPFHISCSPHELVATVCALQAAYSRHNATNHNECRHQGNALFCPQSTFLMLCLCHINIHSLHSFLSCLSLRHSSTFLNSIVPYGRQWPCQHCRSRIV